MSYHPNITLETELEDKMSLKMYCELIMLNPTSVVFSLDLIKTVDAPASIHSASLHPEKDFFVAGGDDFKLYKYDYSTKEEMGRNIVAL